MRKRISLILIILVYIILILIPLLFKLLHITKDDTTFALSTWVLIITGGIIVWYSWETSELRKETQKSGEQTQKLGEEIHLQTELQLLPIVYIMMTHDNISIFNCGESPAFNIEVRTEPDLSNSQNEDFSFKFHKIIFSGILTANDGSSYGYFHVHHKNEMITSINSIFQLMKKYKIFLNVFCENIQKNKYVFCYRAPDIEGSPMGDTQPHKLIFSGYEEIK